ncbi:Eugenol synthase 1 [Vitis vinifera]|uniref:Eugenol synthase 1 n=1 Tax=Vitis vinifera TaxID=29760 RepID=A0A438G4X7_VITVI|nr:Eugenol synthase 1 [Vitis vinifera]
MESVLSIILIFGGTGYIGRYMVKASVKMGHPTYVYSRPMTPQTHPSKIELLKEFQSMGVNIVQGELDEHEKLVSVIQQVDVVISALAYPQVLDQLKIIDAIKVAGTSKVFIDPALHFRSLIQTGSFLPSDFGVEEDRVTVLSPFQEFLDKKRIIRRAIEAAGISYTFVSASCFGAYFVNYLLHPHDYSNDSITVYGSGEAQAVLNYEEDIALYTIKVANDPTACNRIVIFLPPKNIISQLELIALWEKKTESIYILITNFKLFFLCYFSALPNPQNIPVAILHSIFVKGVLMNFEIGEDDIEVSKLYPDINYHTIDQLLHIFLTNPPSPCSAAFE